MLSPARCWALLWEDAAPGAAPQHFVHFHGRPVLPGQGTLRPALGTRTWGGCKLLALIESKSIQGKRFKRNSPSVCEQPRTLSAPAQAQLPTPAAASGPFPLLLEQGGFSRFSKFFAVASQASAALLNTSSALLQQRLLSAASRTLAIKFKQLLRYTTHIIFSPRVLMALQFN